MTAPAFPYKTPPREFQRAALRKGARKEAFAFLFDPGLGKTFTTMMNAAFLFMEGEIVGMLVLAPSGVHTQWVKDQMPAHWPESLPWEGRYWDSSRAGSKRWLADLAHWINNPKDGVFQIFAVNIDAIRVERCWRLIRRFLQLRQCLGTSDESTDIKAPNSQRGRRARLLRPQLPYRRILTATPIEKAFDLYGQYRFLNPRIVGADTYKEMKEQYGEWERIVLEEGLPGTNTDRFFMKFKGYKNLDQLAARIAPHSYRIDVDTAAPELPPLVGPKSWMFELPPKLRAVYDRMEEEHLVELEKGIEVDGSLVVTRYLRLQQIACGYLPVPVQHRGEDPAVEPEVLLEGGEARIRSCMDALEHYPGPTLLFTRFQFDERRVAAALKDRGLKHAVYRGSVDQKDNVKRAFIDGTIDYIIGNTEAMGRGLDGLQRAQFVIHYSRYFRWETYMQANFRARRMGVKHAVLALNIVADRTVDEKITRSHQAKQDVSEYILGLVAQGQPYLSRAA